MSRNELLQEAVASQNSGKRFSAVKLAKENPKAAAVMSKLIVDRRTNVHNPDGSKHLPPPNSQQYRQTAATTAQSVTDAETVMQILPDTDLCAQILVSSVLSPKDMMGTELTYLSAEGNWKLPAEVSTTLLNRARTYFNQDYKIKPLLPKMLTDVLFRTGSYAMAVIPENSIDELINGSKKISMESLSGDINKDGTMRSKGILGPAVAPAANKPSSQQKNSVGLALESLEEYVAVENVDGSVVFDLPAFKADGGHAPALKLAVPITVTDNFNLLKIPEVGQKMREQKIRQMLGGSRALSVENVRDGFSATLPTARMLTDARMSATVYKNPRNKHQQVAVLKTQDKLARRSVGAPLIMHLPSESVIPVHVPNRPEHQIGFFVLIDQEGNPISKADGSDYYKEMGQRMESGSSFASTMLERSKAALGDNYGSNGRGHIDYSAQVYGQMLEEDLLQRIRNGILGKNVVIAKNEEIYRLMMARSLSNQHTQLLFIPAEFMTYIAFRYKSNGIGKSLLEDGKILNSMRTMLLVANVMTSLRNSIGRTHVELKLDPDAPDPMKLVEGAMAQVMQSNNHAFPLGVSSPVDIVDYIQKSAFEFSITGHPSLPDMAIDFTEKNSSYTKPDSDLEELLRKRSIMMYGLTPEMVDAAAGSDFAASVNNNSLLLSKRVLTIQQQFVPLLSDHCRKVIINSSDLVEDLVTVVSDNLDEILKMIQTEEIELSTGEKFKKDGIKTNALIRATIVKEVVEEFIANFTCQLPEPDVAKADNQLEAYKKHEEYVDSAMNAWFGEGMFSEDALGDMSSHIGVVREQMKGYFMREWQLKNGIMPELGQLTARGEDGELEVDLVGNQTDHMKTMIKMFEAFFKEHKAIREKSDALLEATDTTGSSSFSSDSSGGSSSGFDDSGFGGDTTGGEDLGFDESAGGDELLEEEPEVDPDATEEVKEEEVNKATDGLDPSFDAEA